MKQASRFDGLLFDPFLLLQDGLTAPEVDVGGCEVLQALVIAPLIVMLDEGIDLLSEIAGQKVVFQQDAVFQGLVPALDLALGLRMIRGTAYMIHLLIFQPICQLPRDITRPIVREQARLVQNRCLIAARSLQRQVERVGHVARFHRRAELPGDDVTAVIVQDRREIEPAPANHLQIGEVGLPELVWPCGLVPELVGCRQNHIGRAGDQVVRLKDAIDRSL